MPAGECGGDLGRAAHDELRDLIGRDGILWAGGRQPIVHRDGQPAPWALYTSNVTLTARGMHLAARALLDRLSTFRSRQLAGHGYTAMPLLAGCVLLGGAGYTALTIRDRPKAYLTRRQVDGPGDRRQPVVVIDDSISSGLSLSRAIRALESDGYEVEGAVALVHFPGRGGVEWAHRHGYRVATVFDISRDLGMGGTGRTATEQGMPGPPGPELPAGLSPAEAARRTAELYLATGTVPGAPTRLDASYDGRGGVFVSFRVRDSEYRVARDGFWHFDPRRADPCRDLVAAAVRTIRGSGGQVSLANLANLKIAVTFLGPLEQITPADLDFDRYGIVVRDTTFGTRLGGALPNTQVFVSEVEQYRHALRRNARLLPTDPHELFRHTVTKHVEPGETWLPYGCPDGPQAAWTTDESVGRALTRRARQILDAACARQPVPVPGRPLAPTLVPSPVDGVGVTLYRGGTLGSRTVHGSGPLDDLLHRAVHSALEAVPAAERRTLDPAAVSLVVTVLHDQEPLGADSPDHVAFKLRRGLDSLCVGPDGHRLTALPTALPYNNWAEYRLVEHLAAQCPPGRGPAAWFTHRSAVWLDGPHGVHRLRHGFPVRRERPATDDPVARYRGLAEHMAGYLYRGIDDTGLPLYHLDPVAGVATRAGTSPRLVHGLDALAQAGLLLDRDDWTRAAYRGLAHCLAHVDPGAGDHEDGRLNLPGQRNAAIGDCVLLGAAARSPLAGHPAVSALARRVLRLLHPDGRICDGPVRLGIPHDHDFLPGAALVAACGHATVAPQTPLRDRLAAALRWHRDRFRALRTWGMAGWQPQAWAAAFDLTGDAEQARFALEVADWALARQLTKNGAFLEDCSPTEPSFNTGFVAEGIAAAWRVAHALGDEASAARYAASWHRAMSFVTTLVVHPEDTFCFSRPQDALGGVRTSLTRSDIRVDAVSHTLHALVQGLRVLQSSN